jgi:peptidoglycan biosynthesis protein MviN/MurJ (putative lipid II flippase)
MGFEPMIPVFGREKTVHASDRADTITGATTTTTTTTTTITTTAAADNNNNVTCIARQRTGKHLATEYTQATIEFWMLLLVARQQ